MAKAIHARKYRIKKYKQHDTSLWKMIEKEMCEL